MEPNRNPQAAQMGDASMARNLAFQADAIWPQEWPLFERYALVGAIDILDVGCGTGEITRRLAERYLEAQLIGVDILESNLQLARGAKSAHGGRIEYRLGDAYALDIADNSIDLLVCRHVSQSIPDFGLVLSEFLRVLKPGGWLHLLSEDYGMLHFPRELLDADAFWQTHALAYLTATHCDGRIGRHSPALMQRAGYESVAVHYVTVDTLRVARPLFAGVLASWRDGYAEALANAAGRSVEAVTADMNLMVRAVESEHHYVVWHVPIICGRRPLN